VDETHELARRQQEKNKAFLQAAGLREVNEGDAFNRELQEQRKLERAVARQQAEQEREERKKQQEKERKRREKEAKKEAERMEKEREVGGLVLWQQHSVAAAACRLRGVAYRLLLLPTCSRCCCWRCSASVQHARFCLNSGARWWQELQHS
jgi:hypothetical protein